jgi:hypothetical protein
MSPGRFGCINNGHHLLHVGKRLKQLIVHEAIEPAFALYHAGRVEIDVLICAFGLYAANDAAGGLRFSRCRRYLGAHKGVEQRALADIGLPNKGYGGYKCIYCHIIPRPHSLSDRAPQSRARSFVDQQSAQRRHYRAPAV